MKGSVVFAMATCLVLSACAPVLGTPGEAPLWRAVIGERDAAGDVPITLSVLAAYQSALFIAPNASMVTQRGGEGVVCDAVGAGFACELPVLSVGDTLVLVASPAPPADVACLVVAVPQDHDAPERVAFCTHP